MTCASRVLAGCIGEGSDPLSLAGVLALGAGTDSPGVCWSGPARPTPPACHILSPTASPLL